MEQMDRERNMCQEETSEPTFSVIMPAYNRAYCIRTAIDSILRQTYRRYELLIADDGSTDETESLIHSKYAGEISDGRIVYLKLNHAGVCHARNAALRTP